MQMPRGYLQREFTDRIPGQACRVAVELRFFNVEPMLIRLSPPKPRGFDLPVVEDETGRHHPEGDVGAVEPMMGDRSFRNIHAARPVHEGSGSKGGFTWKTCVDEHAGCGRELMAVGTGKLHEQIVWMLPIDQGRDAV